MALFKDNKKFINNNIKNYYNNKIIVVPYGNNRELGYDYMEYSLKLILRYLEDKSEYYIAISRGFLFNRRRGYSKLRKKILEEYCYVKFTVPKNMSVYSDSGINSVILTIKPKNRIDSFQLLEFVKIISSDLFQSMDYDVYLTVLKNLKDVFEEKVIEYSELEFKDNTITECDHKALYLKESPDDGYYSIDKLIRDNV
jgi:hypothetical protein